MSFELGNGIWNSVFAVPTSIADQHIKLASGLSIKVLLLVLRHGGQLDIRQLSALLGQPVSDVQDAVNYWAEKNVFVVRDMNEVINVENSVDVVENNKIPDNISSHTPVEIREKSDSRVTRISNARPRLTLHDINELARDDETIAFLLQETQSVLGKPLTPVHTDTIVSLYSYYGMQPDLILMLVQYCVSIEKSNMRYIERVAADWLERGIDTHEKAETELLRLTNKDRIENRIKSAFGIHDRNLVSSEKKYIQGWLEEMHIDMKLIELAYERTIELKGKLSFPYINGILTNWHKAGVTTPAQAMQEIKSSKPAPDTKSGGASASYDLDEIEKMITYNDIV